MTDEIDIAIRKQRFMDLAAENPGTGPREMARLAGVAYSTSQKWLSEARTIERQHDVEIPKLPDEDLPIETLIQMRRSAFVQKQLAHEARRLIPVSVRLEGPIGITWFGDPHLDDDGCNWIQLERDIAAVRSVRGMFAGNVGDTNNNWVGRLARLWEHQSTSGSQAWKLVEWFVHQLPWLVFLGGNHGAWSGSGDPLRWMLQNAPALHEDMEARMQLQFPNGTNSNVFVRHDFPGHSQWNPTHGISKAASLHGFDDSILVAGHKHTSGYQVVKNPKTGIMSHCVRAAGYKAIDRYAKDNFFTDHNISESIVTIIDPAHSPSDRRHVKVFFDVAEGAEYLDFLRNRAKSAKKVA